MNPFSQPQLTVDDARADRQHIIHYRSCATHKGGKCTCDKVRSISADALFPTIAVAEPPSPRKQLALDAALFERTRADRLELSIRRALIHLGRRERLNAQLELQNALLP